MTYCTNIKAHIFGGCLFTLCIYLYILQAGCLRNAQGWSKVLPGKVSGLLPPFSELDSVWGPHVRKVYYKPLKLCFMLLFQYCYG